MSVETVALSTTFITTEVVGSKYLHCLFAVDLSIEAEIIQVYLMQDHPEGTVTYFCRI